MKHTQAAGRRTLKSFLAGYVLALLLTAIPFGIVATGGQYIIMRCQGFTEPVVTNPADVRQELVRDLTLQKTRRAMIDRMEQLVESSEIDNFFTSVKQVSRTAPVKQATEPARSEPRR